MGEHYDDWLYQSVYVAVTLSIASPETVPPNLACDEPPPLRHAPD